MTQITRTCDRLPVRLYNHAMRRAGSSLQSHGCLLAALAIALTGWLPLARAQEKAAENRPSGVSQADAAPETPAPHRFWDRTNIYLFSGVAVFRGLDYASTRNFMARGREEILLPDDVVNNSAGFAGLEAAATATSVGISYLMHRTGHHSIERWVSIVHIGVTGFGDARNYALKSKHP